MYVIQSCVDESMTIDSTQEKLVYTKKYYQLFIPKHFFSSPHILEYLALHI